MSSQDFDPEAPIKKLMKASPLSQGTKSYIGPKKPFYNKRKTPTGLAKSTPVTIPKSVKIKGVMKSG